MLHKCSSDRTLVLTKSFPVGRKGKRGEMTVLRDSEKGREEQGRGPAGNPKRLRGIVEGLTLLLTSAKMCPSTPRLWFYIVEGSGFVLLWASLC